MDSIIFTADDGEEIEFFVIEQTRINNVNYILVTDTDDEDAEANAYILKDLSEEGSPDALYEMVDDDSEIEYIGRIFDELLDDVDVR